MNEPKPDRHDLFAGIPDALNQVADEWLPQLHALGDSLNGPKPEAKLNGLSVPGLPWSDPNSDPLADIHAYGRAAVDAHEFRAAFEVEFFRTYLQAIDDAVIGDGHVVTDDEARQALADIRAEREFEQMMREFIAHVADRPAGEYRVVMSSEQRAFVRWLHQRHQREGIYRGGRSPALYGVPIVIEETADRPRLEHL